MKKTLNYKVVFLRHGESHWNQENRFTGWTDVDLTEVGIKEAEAAGKKLKNWEFDVVHTSMLKRAVKTWNIIAEEIDHHHILVSKSWRLNERHYGALQGLNKSETAIKLGEEKVKLWRRSYSARPPELDIDDERYPGKEEQYKKLPLDLLPLAEVLLN